MSYSILRDWFARFPPRAKDALGVLFFCAVLAGMVWRMSHKVLIPGEPIVSEQRGTSGMGDFRDAVYYPMRAALDGVNPYDCDPAPGAEGKPRYRNNPKYPVLNIFPLFSPLILLLFLPFGLIGDFTTSMWLYGTFHIALLLVYSYVAWRCVGRVPTVASVCFLAGVMLITQPGRANFIAGQLALPLTLGMIGALHWSRTRPWLSSMALTLATFKPTFGVPLALLLFCRRDFRPAITGMLAGGIIAVVGVAVIFGRSGDLGRIVEIVRQNQHELESDPGVAPVTSKARIDALAVVDRCLGGSGGALLKAVVPLLLLAVSGGALWLSSKRHDSHSAAGPIGALVILTVLTSIYHLFYDALPLWIPILSLLFAPSATWNNYSVWARRVLLLLLLVPVLNIFCTDTFRDVLHTYFKFALPWGVDFSTLVWDLGCTASGLSLLLALGLVAVTELRLAAVNLPALESASPGEPVR